MKNKWKSGWILLALVVIFFLIFFMANEKDVAIVKKTDISTPLINTKDFLESNSEDEKNTELWNTYYTNIIKEESLESSYICKEFDDGKENFFYFLEKARKAIDLVVGYQTLPKISFLEIKKKVNEKSLIYTKNGIEVSREYEDGKFCFHSCRETGFYDTFKNDGVEFQLEYKEIYPGKSNLKKSYSAGTDIREALVKIDDVHVQIFYDDYGHAIDQVRIDKAKPTNRNMRIDYDDAFLDNSSASIYYVVENGRLDLRVDAEGPQTFVCNNNNFTDSYAPKKEGITKIQPGKVFSENKIYTIPFEGSIGKYPITAIMYGGGVDQNHHVLEYQYQGKDGSIKLVNDTDKSFNFTHCEVGGECTDNLADSSLTEERIELSYDKQGGLKGMWYDHWSSEEETKSFPVELKRLSRVDQTQWEEIELKGTVQEYINFDYSLGGKLDLLSLDIKIDSMSEYQNILSKDEMIQINSIPHNLNPTEIWRNFPLYFEDINFDGFLDLIIEDDYTKILLYEPVEKKFIEAVVQADENLWFYDWSLDHVEKTVNVHGGNILEKNRWDKNILKPYFAESYGYFYNEIEGEEREFVEQYDIVDGEYIKR